MMSAQDAPGPVATAERQCEKTRMTCSQVSKTKTGAAYDGIDAEANKQNRTANLKAGVK